MKTQAKDCVIFDVDGTLFDTGEGIRDCARHALEELGAHFPEDKLNLFIGPSLYYSFHETVGLSEEQSERGVQLYRERYKTTGIDMSRPYDGVPELLHTLEKDGYILTVASSKPISMVEYLLEKYRLRSCFAALAAAEFATRTSDKADYVRSAAKGARNVMVGDTHFDIDGAHAAGVPVIAAAYGFGARETLSHAEFIADSVQEVYGYIRKYFQARG